MVGGADGCGLDRLQRREACFHHQGELLRVVAMGRDAGVGAEGDLYAGLRACGARMSIILGPASRAFAIWAGCRKVPGSAASRSDEVAGEQGGDQVGAVLLVEPALTSASENVPCSIESPPARRKELMPSTPWACAVTLRPIAWAACDDGFQFLVGELLVEAGRGAARARRPWRVILMMSAPSRTRSRTARAQSSAPEHTPGRAASAPSRAACRWRRHGRHAR